MSIKLYKADISPPVRSVMMLCEFYKLPVEYIDVNLMAGEQYKPEFVKLNPLHAVPTLVDGDIVLHDSHAILMYLAEKYGKNDLLYPADLKQRALINQKLFFEISILYMRLRNVTAPIFIEGAKGVDDKKLKAIEEAYGFLEEFLTRTRFLAGDNLTIADISAYTTVSGLTYILPVDVTRYPKLDAWIRHLRQQPYSKKVNDGPGTAYGEIIRKAVHGC